MEAKKNPAIDIYKMSTLFYSIGLVVSMSIVYGVFHIKFADNIVSLELSNDVHHTEEIMIIPPTRQPPPPPPKLQLTQIVETANEELIIEDIPIIDMEMQENTSIEAVAYKEDFEMDAPEEQVDKIFQIVETQAEPVGGVKAFYEYVASQLKGNYPAEAERLNIQGVVYLQFVIEKDGSLTDIKAVKGIGSGCDELAIEVLKGAPNWNPGKQRGKAVRTSKMVPIRFVLKRR